MERHNRPASPASRHIARSTIPASRHFSTREGGACSSRNFATESSKMTMSSSLRKSARSIFKTGIAVLPERLLPPAHWGDRIAEGWSLSSLIVCLCSCCRRSAACGSREPFGQPKRELICDGSEWDKVNVNCVAFGLVRTRLTQAIEAEQATIDVAGREIKVGIQPQLLTTFEKLAPLGRGGTPEEAADAVYLFCTPRIQLHQQSHHRRRRRLADVRAARSGRPTRRRSTAVPAPRRRNGRRVLACIMQRRDDPRRSAARSGDFSEPGLLVHAPHRLRLWA